MKDYDKKSNEFEMTALCGIYCGACECHIAKDNPKLMEYLINIGIKSENLPCPGCRKVEGNCPAIKEKCETYECAMGKNVDFCFQCRDFPCEKLNPSADRAEKLPHNLKAYNLCCIQHQGLEKFAANAINIKEKYFKGKMSIGKGPQL